MPLFYAEAMGLKPVVAYEVSNGMYRITGTEEGALATEIGL